MTTYVQQLKNLRTVKIDGTAQNVERALARVDMQLDCTKPGKPRIKLAPRVQVGSLAIGRVDPFTRTKKMQAPSFSLPAGPLKLGGTCTASGIARVIRDPGKFICRGCYAIDGNYRYPTMQFAQAVRKAWVSRVLEQEGWASLAEQLYVAIQTFNETPQKVKVKYQDREDTLILSPDYFRIHDSGDVAWGSFEYFQVWCAVAEALDPIEFWMPTRDWVLPAWKERYTIAPANLAVRPSALHVDDPPPSMAGVAPGTSVTPVAHAGVWQCPVYLDEAYSCGTANCRECWQHDRAVNYRPHAGISKEGKVRKANPAPRDVEEAFDLYSRVRQNPEESFDDFLRREKLHRHLSEEDWARWWDVGDEEVVERLEEMGL